MIQVNKKANFVKRVREIVHDDGKRREQRYHTTAVRQPLRHDREAAELGAYLQSRGFLYGDLQREGARSARSKAEQTVAESQGTQCPGPVRGWT